MAREGDPSRPPLKPRDGFMSRIKVDDGHHRNELISIYIYIGEVGKRKLRHMLKLMKVKESMERHKKRMHYETYHGSCL